jgi:choline dehydrogenase-like flavoprotein
MPSRKEPFKVDNEAIGTVASEHVSTSLGMKYTGEEKESPNNVHFDPDDYTGNMEHLNNYVKHRSGPYAQFGPVVASHFVADMSEIKGLNETYPEQEYEAPLSTQDAEGKTRVTTELFYNPYGLGHPTPPVSKLSMNPYNGPGTFTIAVMLLSPEQRGLFRLKPDGDTAEYPDLYLNETPQPAWDPTPEQREKLQLPDYRKLAEHDIGVMTASVKEVISLTDKPNSDIKLTLGPGDGQTHPDHKAQVTVDGQMTGVPIADLDPNNPDHVKGYVTFWDKQEHSKFTVNGEYVAITHWQENHFNSTVPLARNFDVFGNELGDRKAKYGVDPDTCEVRGTKGLCIADASLFPKVVYCHPIGAVMALAEWAVDQILSEE